MVVAGAMETRLFQNILQTKSSFIPTRNALVGRENKMELFFLLFKGAPHSSQSVDMATPLSQKWKRFHFFSSQIRVEAQTRAINDHLLPLNGEERLELVPVAAVLAPTLQQRVGVGGQRPHLRRNRQNRKTIRFIEQKKWNKNRAGRVGRA